jgi:hypothetical protein
LRTEASRSQYSDQRLKLLDWCDKPDDELFRLTRRFANGRLDTNPFFAYTVGTRNDDQSGRVQNWTKERVNCANLFTNDISPVMSAALDRVRGNLCAFALRFASKYPEFKPLSMPLDGCVLIVVAHRRPNKDGKFEVIDGAHRGVALCQAQVKEVDAYKANVWSI